MFSLRMQSCLRCLLALLCLCLTTAKAAEELTYNAELPPALFSSPKLCDFAPCEAVLPGASSFSARKGTPPYVEAYREVDGKPEKIGYVMLSTDITDIPAYSGKPVITLIGMDLQGHFTGVRILKHSEPILLLGIPESALVKFNQQYIGKFVGDKIEIGQSKPEENIIGLDAITGATVTVIAQNQVMMQSGVEVGNQVGILKAAERPAAVIKTLEERLDWAALVREGSVRRLLVMPQDVGLRNEGKPYIEMHFGYLNVPSVGKALLGNDGYARLLSSLKEGEHAIFIIRTQGEASFKGSGFVRGGIYDRIQLRQGRNTVSFRDLDYLNLYGINAAGVPAYNESAIFILRDKHFSAAYPWDMIFLGNKVDRETGSKTFARFEQDYWLPARYLEGGHPQIEKPMAAWERVWRDKRWVIAGFVVFLLLVGASYACRDVLVRRAQRRKFGLLELIKYSAWAVSIGFAGFYAMAQPSVTQVLTWFHSLLFKWEWTLFLSDPLIFVFWVFIIATAFVWGRGLFCGWLCPFGSLSEGLYKLGGWLGLKRWQRHLPQKLHDRLKYLKYAIFIGLLGVSFIDMGLAEKLAEVEPFKTTFLVGFANRSWPYVTYSVLLLALAVLIERPFCKYLCPLGAALAIPTTFRWFGLKRKPECTSCQACAHGCGSLAIDKKGNIDQRECMLCLECMVLYYDDHACPPLAKERKLRQKSGQPLTPIDAKGYFIPIIPVREKQE